MALKLSTKGASTTLKFLSDSLVFEQPNAVNKFKFKRGKLIFAPKTIYSDNLIIEAESIIWFFTEAKSINEVFEDVKSLQATTFLTFP